MTQHIEQLREQNKLRLIAGAIEHLELEGIACATIPLPGTKQVLAIGEPAAIEHLLAQAAQVAAPEGWKLIPIKPTQEMLRAAWDKANDAGELLEPSDAYRTMLAASPAPPAPQLRMQEVRADVERWAASHAGELKQERDRFERMFMAACEDLGAINEALGLDPDDGGAEPIIEAIDELKAQIASHAAASAVPAPAGQYKDGWPSEIYLNAGDDPLGHFSEYDEVSWCDHPQGESDVRYVRADAATPSTAAVRADEWISVDDERKPEAKKPVLLYVRTLTHSEDDDGNLFDTEGAEVAMGEYLLRDGFDHGYFDCYTSPMSDNDCVTHWMPLPTAPVPAADGGNRGAK